MRIVFLASKTPLGREAPGLIRVYAFTVRIYVAT